MRIPLFLLSLALPLAIAACGDASREDVLKPGSTFRDCDRCPEMVVIPGGSFVMGSPLKEPMAFPHEQPQRTVTVKPFALGVYEVSFAEWELCVSSGGCDGYMPREREDSTPDHPAETISYNDAQAFVDWLNEQVDEAPYRLPSEAEWEYAARAGTTTAFWWGDAIGPENANYKADQLYRGGGSTGEALGKSVPVKSFAPNPFGLYQMNGNVAEWTSDCWHWRYDGAPTDGSPWMSEDDGDCGQAHFRGGNYIDRPDLLRSASRYSIPRHRRSGFIGVRVARDLPELARLKQDQQDPVEGAPREQDHSMLNSDGERQDSTELVAGLETGPPCSNEAVSILHASGGFSCITPGSGESFRDCDTCPEMVVAPAGSFMMGSPESEEGRYGSEGPQRRVTIGRPFAIGKFEVTWDEWEACVADGGCDNGLGGQTRGDNDWGKGRRPVISVSWEDGQAYVRWLSGKTGRSYRLLSEAEWEYAARAGTATRFHFGDNVSGLEQHAWYSSNANERTHPVGEKAANAWGLHDMHGNVWEWVEDCYSGSYHGSATYYGSATDGSARTSKNCASSVVRGGSFAGYAQILRSANRGINRRRSRNRDLGFRVARM